MGITCRDLETVLGCRRDAAGVPIGTVVVHYEYRRNALGNTVVHAVRYAQSDGTTITLGVGETVTPGACPVADVERRLLQYGQNIASGTFTPTFDPAGNGAVWSTFGINGPLQSVTVTALRAGTPGSGNTVVVTFGATGTKMWLVQGQSFTWSVAQDAASWYETLDRDISVDCQGNAAANLVWTEQV